MYLYTALLRVAVRLTCGQETICWILYIQFLRYRRYMVASTAAASSAAVIVIEFEDIEVIEVIENYWSTIGNQNRNSIDTIPKIRKRKFQNKLNPEPGIIHPYIWNSPEIPRFLLRLFVKSPIIPEEIQAFLRIQRILAKIDTAASGCLWQFEVCRTIVHTTDRRYVYTTYDYNCSTGMGMGQKAVGGNSASLRLP